MLLSINKLFKKPAHPFNMQQNGEKTYAEWQFENGERTIAFYLKRYTRDEMFKDKNVLDVGCGAGGKSLYYASIGAKRVTGMDIMESYAKDSAELADKLSLSGKFEFAPGDAAKMPFGDGCFDSIIINDAMEHVGDPAAVLRECMRVLAGGGRLYVNFPPYNHPYGAHLSDAIGIPWVHLFFGQKSLIRAYKKLVGELPDGEKRISFRISKRENGEEYFSYINKMTIKKFKKLIADLNLEMEYYREEKFAKIPVLKEFFTRMVVCAIKKQCGNVNIKEVSAKNE
ncbi:MAG: class I SAM-dependent methyltransferase [Oscillospiraceae bacterium]|nr:class I SAM-dependent methyltransferase [Oscillospiraceae bacterium]